MAITKKTVLRLLVAGALTGGLLGTFGTRSALTANTPPLPACTGSPPQTLVPQLGTTTVNQGVGSYADSPNLLVRGKDTLVRFFLVNSSAVNSVCSGTTYIRSANLTVTNGAASYSTAALQSFGSSGTPIPPTGGTVSVDSNADPKFVVPANVINSCLSTPGCTDNAQATFTLTFTVSITYSTSLSSTPVTLSPSPVATATFDRSSNALRVLAIPMGDKSQAYSSQFSSSAQTAVENGFAALSRIYPVPNGVSSALNTTSGGIRYKLDLAAMLDLKSIAGAYDSNNKFCGSQANFDAGIKGQLTGFLSIYNGIPDTNQRADRVMGVVDKNISDGSASNCAEAMASTVSPETWVRAIPDQPASGKNPPVPSMTGPLMAMEMAHTFNLGTPSLHSPNIPADLTAPDRAYNVSSRSYLADDRSTMHFVSTNPFNNNNALFERDDFEHMLCNLGGSFSANCTAAVTGTALAARRTFAKLNDIAPTFVIFGTTDLISAAGTHVLESFGSQNNTVSPPSPDSDLVLKFFNSTGVLKEVKIPYSKATSEHDSATNVNTDKVAVFGGVFEAPQQGYTKVQLVHGTTVLYERSSTLLEAAGAGIGSASPGGSLTVGKTLTTPVIPPKPDVVFLGDTTGSMGSAIDNVKSNVVSIMNQVLAAQPQAQFGVASYKDFNCTLDGVTETPFSLDRAVTADSSAVQAAINTWTVGNPNSGCDPPEAQLWALHKLATDPGVGWRTGSNRIVVWVGDAPGHDPSNDITLDMAISELKAAGIRVIAINLVNTLANTSLDQTGQATAIVNATGGILRTTTDPAQVSPSILEGLRNVPATVTHELTSCDPALAVTFDTEAKTVPSGDPVSWTETVNIASSATQGSTLTCTVHFLVNGVLPDDPAFTQTISIKLTGGTAVVGTFNADNLANFRGHVIYDCGNGEKLPASIALEGTQVAPAVIQIQNNLDPSLSCANATGTASLTIVGTNGVNAVSQTVPTSSSTLPVADKAPSAAIYQPTVDALIPFTSPLSLNGHVADPEDGNLNAHWSIVSGPAQPSIPEGDVVDVQPPSEGWPAGDYVIQLSGTDSDGHTATATVTVHVAHYTFAGFFQPVDNPPVKNTGKAGSTYPLKWSLSQNGSAVSDLRAVVALRFVADSCGTQPADPLETTVTGGTDLRYDATAQQYVYNWQTPKQPGCYVLTLTLADGTTLPAFFQLK